MEKLNKILDYFISYEIAERLNNIGIEKDSFLNVKRGDLVNLNNLNKILLKKKVNLIKYIVKKIYFKNKNNSFKLNNCLDDILEGNLDLESNFVFSSLINEKDYTYPDNYKKDLAEINNIIKDNQLIILFPVLANGKKKIPLICFQLAIKDNKLIVYNYNIQRDALKIIFSSLLECEISEVEVLIKDFQSFYESISIIENDNIFDIVTIIEDEITGKFGSNIFNKFNNYKNFDKWAVTEEIILTMTSFGDMLFPPYQDEIEEVKYLLKDTNSSLLTKYLIGNNSTIQSNQIEIKSHFGSYSGDFSINEKQSKVITAYEDAELLAVNGPPGTGKTTVLKEIIANNIVKKTKQLIDVWDNSWKVEGVGNQSVHLSPLLGKCDNSMVIASGNNEAVNNIGVELLQEIPYFYEAIKDNELGYNGTLCAKLGNYNNMSEFRFNILTPLISYLSANINYNENEATIYKEEYLEIYNELLHINKDIEEYISQKEKICYKISKLLADSLEINTENVRNKLASLINTWGSLNELLQENKDILNELYNKEEKLNQCLLNKSQLISSTSIEINTKKTILFKMNKNENIFLIGSFLNKSLERKYGNKNTLEKEIYRLEINQSSIEGIYDRLVNEQADLKNQIENIKKDLEDKSEELNLVDENILELEQFDKLKLNFNVIVKLGLTDINWNSPTTSFFNHAVIVKKRNHLFNISLKINELYIKKYADDIVFNLDKIYQEQWFKPFYRRDFRYNDTYKSALKAVWETLFLCFPVVTTTFYSLDKRKFPMINGIFDTLLIDEAGQSALHMAVGPLYRFRKAVIVGDVFQLQPIHKHKNNLIENYDAFNDLEKVNLNIDENSIQRVADRNTDYFDLLGGFKVGIVLNEHRRCERSIVEFSNKYVYDNCLEIVKEDTEKEFLKSSLCMLDIRGSSDKNSNELELEICSKVVAELVTLYGEEYKKNIGIITPFRNQAKKLQKNIPDVKSGTVHVFQGQEKEVIIMSLVVDDRQSKSKLDFIGNTANFLNVAFTRAKKQLIIIGNYEVCANANNYLTKAVATVKKHGILYSLYEPVSEDSIHIKFQNQFLTVLADNSKENDYLNSVINQFTENGIIDGADKHNKLLHELLVRVEHSASIITPWIRYNVVDGDLFNKMTKLINEDKAIDICFGYNKTNFTLNEIDKIVQRDNKYDNEKDISTISNLAHLLKKNLHYVPPIHTKVLIIDDKIMIIGSHNWLSNTGKQYYNQKDEIGCIIFNQDAISYIKRRYKIGKNKDN